MTPTEPEKKAPDLQPHGDILRTPGTRGDDGGRPPGDPGPGGPSKPVDPVPYPENPDLPSHPKEPGEPGQGQPIPPELDTTKPRL